jgi:uncharacterized UPF0160 family protein
MTHGSEAVEILVQEMGWDYPVSVTRLENAYPLKNIKLNERGDWALLAELLIQVDADRFESREHLEAELQPVIEAEVSQRAGIVGRAKRLLSSMING